MSAPSSSGGGAGPGGSSSKKAITAYASDTLAGTVPPHKLAAVPEALLVRTLPGQHPSDQQSWYTGAPPSRSPDGSLRFADAPAFTPNLTPAEIMQAGAFGGYYFRPIASCVTGRVHVDAWREFPDAWWAGLPPAKRLASHVYNAAVNKYGVSSGQDLRQWEEQGWIAEQDPFGWFQWYCRFYMGRRSEDDPRQISRWSKVAGVKGRWKANLISKVVAAGAAYDDAGVSPVVRQTLLHWAYTLTEKDCEAYTKRLAKGSTAPYVSGALAANITAAAAQRVASSKAKGKAKGKAAGGAGAGSSSADVDDTSDSEADASGSSSRKRKGK